VPSSTLATFSKVSKACASSFKPVNDGFGHHIGDLVLQAVARRMLDCVRESDSVAHRRRRVHRFVAEYRGRR